MRLTDRPEPGFGPAWVAELLRLTVSDPTLAAERVLGMPLPRQAVWQAVALTAIVSAILIAVMSGLFLTRAGDLIDPVSAQILAALARAPVSLAVSQFVFATLLALALDRLGGAFGGRGSFDGALKAVAWMQVCLCVLLALQSVAFLILPILAGLVSLAGTVLWLWAATSFILSLHGFTSRLAVFVMMILAFVLVEMAMAMLAAIVSAVLT